MHTVNGVRVGLLAYTYGTNGVPVPAATPWLVNLVNVPKILADAHAARLAGAQFVAVSMHWGQENQTAPTALQRSQAAALLASPDVDLIIGDHVHVVQPIERIGSKYVIYGFNAGELGASSAGPGLGKDLQGSVDGAGAAASPPAQVLVLVLGRFDLAGLAA